MLWSWIYSKRNLKNYRKKNYRNKYLKNANIQVDNVWYFSIGFIGFMLEGKSLLDYTNLFSPNEHETNDEIILKYFQWLKSLRWKNILRYLW